MIRELNQLLEDGYHLDVNKAPTVIEETILETTTLADAIEHSLEIKKPSLRSTSYPSYKSSVKIFIAWASENKISGIDIVYFDRLRAVYFNDYLLVDCGYNPVTVNGHISYLKTLFQILVEREFIGENPFKNIPKHKETTSRRNRAFRKSRSKPLSR